MRSASFYREPLMPTDPIYLDYNATTPIADEVAEAMRPYLDEVYGNPSSAHPYGQQTRAAVEKARAQVAALLGCQPAEVVFTSGGTESNNTVIKGVAEASGGQGGHIVVSVVEHPAVLEPCRWLAGRGYRITRLPVDGLGRVAPDEVASAIEPDTILVSVMLANNEVGTIQPIAEIGQIAHARGVLLHSDAAQAVGKIPVDVNALGVDFLSVAGHKFYAPKGIGALFIREGRHIAPLMHGAGQESGRRAGTENVLEIVGLGQAAEMARRELPDSLPRIRQLRDRLWEALAGSIPDIRRNGDPAPDGGLPNTLSVSFRQVEANTLLGVIGDRVAASAGAACHANSVTISKVLEAMHVPLDYAMGTVRLSLGLHTTAEEVDDAAKIIAAAVGQLR
jgi:cysteine desulfurase